MAPSSSLRSSPGSSPREPSPAPAAHRAEEFRDLVMPLWGALLARASVLERSSVEAWDLVQDTLERALRGFHQFRPGTNVRRWLFRIMHNLFIDRYRRRAHEMRALPIEELELATPEPEPIEPWERLIDVDLEPILAGLERPFRQVLELHFLQRQSYQDISRSLRIPAATVGTRLMRARHKLRGMIDPAVSEAAGPRLGPHPAPQPARQLTQRLRGRGMA
jgi:RNA polymerase sigma-70 factor, ECF subfamily